MCVGLEYIGGPSDEIREDVFGGVPLGFEKLRVDDVKLMGRATSSIGDGAAAQRGGVNTLIGMHTLDEMLNDMEPRDYVTESEQEDEE